MSNPDGPGPDPEPSAGAEPDTLAAEQYAADFETEVISTPDAGAETAPPVVPGERRFTAPSGMDAGSTQVIRRNPDPATEIIDMGAAGFIAEDIAPHIRTAVPQEIPPRGKSRIPIRPGRWGWVLAVLLVIAALAAVAALGALLINREHGSEASPTDPVRATIHRFAGARLVQPAETLRPALCRSLQASTTRSLIDASAFLR